MKYAIVDGIRAEASKGANGTCPSCGATVIPKCGELRIDHWAHRGERNCDPWWENETEWHRSWKGMFPVDWQEIAHHDSTGERHIADVKTPENWVLEFQHSFLDPAERKSRNEFYKKIVWVVDGLRRKTDVKQFRTWVETGSRVSPSNPLFKVHFPEECRLVREWESNSTLTFFDFNQQTQDGDNLIWLLFPRIFDNTSYVSWFSRNRLVQLNNTGTFQKFIDSEINEILNILRESNNRTRNEMVAYGRLLANRSQPFRRPRRRL